MKEDLDGYRLALKIEADSVRFYENAAKKERREDVKAILHRIAEEEKDHFNIVENIYDFVLKPKYFLAWGEFSNLKEF
jgi:rubrerythrin